MLAKVQDCTGCMACVASCRVSALSMRIGDDGHAYFALDANKCVGCLSCESACKAARAMAGDNDLSVSKPYAAWANADSVRDNATSGGFATAAGQWCINDGGYVVGSAFDGRRASHVLVSDTANLMRLQGSKYVWSNPEAAYKAIEDKLQSGKVLFIGTGCQVAGVLAYFAGNKYRNNLYTIDLICGGVPSDLLMQSFLEGGSRVEAVTSFRSKRKYELKGLVDGKEVVLPSESLPLSGFCAEQTMRYRCYDCPFAFAHRQSDITIGDLWGDASPAPQREKGVSLVVVHSEKGQEMLEGADVATVPLDWKEVLPANRRLVFGRTPKTRLRKKLAENYRSMDPSTFSRVYSVSSPVTRPGGFVTRVWLHMLRRLNSFRGRRAINVILGK